MYQKKLHQSVIFVIVLLTIMTLVSYFTSLFIDDEELRLMIYVLVSPLVTIFFQLKIRQRPIRALFIKKNVSSKKSPVVLYLGVPFTMIVLYLIWNGMKGLFTDSTTPIHLLFLLFSSIGIAYILRQMEPTDFRWAKNGKYLFWGVILPMLPPGFMVLGSWITGEIQILKTLSAGMFLVILLNGLFYFILHMGQLLREELTFRGYLVRNLAQHPLIAIIFTGISFGLWHVPIFLFTNGGVNWEYFSPMWILSTIISSFASGTLFAYLFLRTQNLLIPTISHSISDTVRDLFVWAPVYSNLHTFQDYYSYDETWLNVGGTLLILISIILLVCLVKKPLSSAD